jgi:hypothetical protein
MGTPLVDLDVVELAIALIVALAMSVVLAWQYSRYGHTYSNRTSLAYTIPLITLTIVLIITVVKSSLALSLGLVGALSIVRFRTPIKEPEELAYLFMAIALGISAGANQILASVVGFGIFVIFATLRNYVRSGSSKRNLYININATSEESGNLFDIEQILTLVTSTVVAADLRRVDAGASSTQAIFYVEVSDDAALVAALSSMRKALPAGSSVTFIDQDTTLGS